MKLDTTKYAAMVANAAARVKISSTIFKNFIADVKSVIDGNDDVVTAHLADEAAHGFMQRQAIINGNFDVWQRGTSFTNALGSTYIADRFIYTATTDGGISPTTITHSRLTLTPGDIPDAFFGYRIAVDGAGSSYGNSSQHSTRQRIEHGVRNLCGLGKKVTLSFWARSSIVGKRIGVALQQVYGTGGTPSSTEWLPGQIITLTSNWTKYTFTFTTNTLVGKTFGTNNDDYLSVNFYYQWGTNTAANAFGGGTAESFGGSGNIDIAQVHVHEGDEDLPFPVRSYAEELALCQRYFELIDFNAMVNIFRSGTKTISCRIPFKVPKRTTPSLSSASDLSTTFGTGSKQLTFNRTADDVLITATGNVTISGNAAPYTTINMGSFSIVAATSLSGTSGDPLYVAQTVKDTVIGFDAEL